MSESIFDELKRYVGFSARDEQLLRDAHALLAPAFPAIADVFYDRILQHEDARKVLEGGERHVGRLKVTLVEWLDKLLKGPYDDAYYQLRARIGRMHVRISLPQHYMFGAMNVVRQELAQRISSQWPPGPTTLQEVRTSLGKILDLELAIMLHTYREDLLSQNARAERLATFGQLVGSIGHELRNPLGVIETSLFLLKSQPDVSDKSARHFERIGEQLQLANNIITHLLDMIRDRPLVRKPLSLKATLETAVSSLNWPPEVKVHLLGLSDEIRLQGDVTLLGQVAVNLLKNAIEACGPRGVVRVQVMTGQGQVTWVVEDSGPGVDESVRVRLFEPLVSNKEKGIGLGLALVRRIVERHGGSISYSRGSLGGARFTIQLPGEG